jgi:hypothetical protein
MSFSRHPSSYRDPSGFLFYKDAILYRQVNKSFKNDFDLFIQSGLYEGLLKKNLIISHQTIDRNITGSADWYQTLQPLQLPYISYPCEWSFNMLKDAALATLQLAEEGIKYGMMLKDASAYNIQLHEGSMKLIDTLSFEKYDASKPWIAYRQFCEHFYAPLALMHYSETALSQLFLTYPDGIPLNVAASLLPARSKFNLNTYLHIHLQKQFSNSPSEQKQIKPFTESKLKNILRSLRESIQSFKLDKRSGVWSGYYEEASQRNEYLMNKKAIIEEWILKLQIQRAVDLGANEGGFSELLWKKNIYTISSDFDHYSINKLYTRIKKEGITNVHPLVLDLSSPTPAFGVNNGERDSFINRTKTDLVMALALIHHLAIAKNIPFEDICTLFRSLGKYLLIEFVPKEDEKIRIMLQNRQDIFNWYSEDNFLKAFSAYYHILDQKGIADSGRTLFLMQLHEA